MIAQCFPSSALRSAHDCHIFYCRDEQQYTQKAVFLVLCGWIRKEGDASGPFWKETTSSSCSREYILQYSVAPMHISTSSPPKIRFSYLNSQQQNQVLMANRPFASSLKQWSLIIMETTSLKLHPYHSDTYFWSTILSFLPTSTVLYQKRKRHR